MRRFVIPFRKHQKLSSKEWIALLITSLVSGFVFAFDKWGDEAFSAAQGVANVIIYGILTLIILLSIELGRRVWASTRGYKVEYRMWPLGLVVSVFFAFYTFGGIQFILPGGYALKEILHMRTGHYQHRFRIRDNARIGLAGTFTSVFATLIIYAVTNSWSLAVVAMTIVIASIVPLDILLKVVDKKAPLSAGTTILIDSRAMLFFTVAFILVAFLLIKIATPITAFILALVAAVIAGFAWFWIKEL